MPRISKPLIALTSIARAGRRVRRHPMDQPSARGGLCDSLAAFSAAFQAIADLDPATDSIEDLQAAGQAAEDAWAQVLTDAADVEAADTPRSTRHGAVCPSRSSDFSTDVPVADAVAEGPDLRGRGPGVYAEMRDGRLLSRPL